MQLLHDKRGAGVLALLSVLLAVAPLFLGIGSADAAPASPCNDDGWPVPDFNVTTGTGPYSTYAGVGAFTGGAFGDNGAYVCFSPTGGEPAQSYVVLTTTVTPSSTNVSAGHCGPVPTSGPPSWWACNTLLDRTGTEGGAPSVSPTAGGATPGGTATTGPGTCVYVDGTTHPALCPGAADVAGVNLATGDVSVTTKTTPGGCITAFGNPCYTTGPVGAGAAVAKGDASNDTVSTTVAGAPVSRDLGDCYGYNMGTCP